MVPNRFTITHLYHYPLAKVKCKNLFNLFLNFIYLNLVRALINIKILFRVQRMRSLVAWQQGRGRALQNQDMKQKLKLQQRKGLRPESNLGLASQDRVVQIRVEVLL